MSNKNGIQLISVPKSGTMFFSRCVEKATGISPVYGLHPMTTGNVARDIGAVNQHIFRCLSKDSCSMEQLSRRYSLFRAKNRGSEVVGDAISFYSDHGLRSFAKFLVDPREDDVEDPEQLIATAQTRRHQLVYLRRDIKAVANSLVHFLVEGKSRLVRIGDMAQATHVVCEFYVPVLARLIRRWTPYLSHPSVLALRFEELLDTPGPLVRNVCEHAGMPVIAPETVSEAEQQKSWTYRINQTARWTDTFSQAQQFELQRVEAALDVY
ncbi:hypothetical protein J2794_006192 [Paraburkholderia terricola]|jgi:hypothetical protein|uniref:sulfotransferase domain-containing protein n=1 Tax=Paraburkholderia terricola TaxID=169427 RepID=UPI002866B7AB|nr:sulfotransferase domain-containing protein [Paraburkholderia terricola]MDR6450052.1 hypothetical protein [Paraburkholderia terricola]